MQKQAAEKINYRDPENFIPLNEIYLGAAVSAVFLNPDHGIPAETEQCFRTRCLEFYIESAKEISTRFDFNDPVLQALELIDPEIVKEGEVNSIIPLAIHFPNLVQREQYQDIDTEWRLLRNFDKTDLSNDAEQFWVAIGKKLYNDGAPMFGNVSQFAISLLCLHSSANVERLFSQVNLIKTDSRNRISSGTLAGLLHTKQYIQGKNCFDIEINAEMLKMHNNDMYKKRIDVYDSDEYDDKSTVFSLNLPLFPSLPYC